MDGVHLASQLSPESLRIVGIGVYKDAKHIGMLCRESSDKKLRFIHLAFHDDLRLDDDTAKCFLWVEAKLEDESASVAAAQARRIYRRYQAGGIPYGFSPYTGYFGPQGEIRWTAPGNGLTCVTFVLAVFDSAGVRLVKGETWPVDRPEDKQFQREMIKLVDQQSGASAAHLKAMKADVGQIRPRVLEVAVPSPLMFILLTSRAPKPLVNGCRKSLKALHRRPHRLDVGALACTRVIQFPPPIGILAADARCPQKDPRRPAFLGG